MTVIGHRGACGLYPENTLLSFRKAMEAGCGMLEMDLHRTRDGHLAVIHDNTLQRTTGCRGEVSGFSAEELKRLDAGEGEGVPVLEDVLDLTGEFPLNLELKGEGSAELLSEFIHRRALDLSVLLISSFRWEFLRHLRREFPHLRMGVLSENLTPEVLDTAESLGAWSIHLKDSLVTRSVAHRVVDRGFRPLVYTVNSRDRAGELAQWGVWGVFTDLPGHLTGS